MKHKLSLKQWLAAAFFFSFFVTATLLLYGRNHEDARFNAFTETFLLGELTANPISFHYSVMSEQDYGIDESSLRLPIYTANQTTYEAQQLSVILEQLTAFHPEKLSDDNRYFYIALSNYLNAAKAVSSYPYFAEPLSPSSGSPFQLPILLAEYRLENKSDIENYFSILSQIPDYFKGLILYEKEKAAAGLFMSDETADKVIEECMKLMDASQLKEGNHFLDETFLQRLQKLEEKGILTKEEILAYQAENDRLLTTVAAPAYDYLADEVTLLKGSGKDTCGLAHYTGGREYYTALLRLQTGSYKSMDEIKKMLYDDLITNYQRLIQLLRDNPSLQNMMIQEPELFPEMTPYEILSLLQEEIKADYPAIPQTQEDNAVHCEIKYVNECLEPYTAPAFYMIPPVDNINDNTIYINAQDTDDELSLFTTLAHEGYPGHLYQTIYSQRFLAQNHISPLRSTLYHGGFVEGWAMYTELNSYGYAAKLAGNEHPETYLYYLACRLDRQIQLCLYSLLDIAIHYDGASLDDVRNIFALLGATNDTIICAIYEYIVEEPANYLKYYLGYLEILELRKEAASLWYDNPSQTVYENSDFLYRFHLFLLENGPSDFKTLSILLAAGQLAQ